MRRNGLMGVVTGLAAAATLFFLSCAGEKAVRFTGAPGEVKLITLDPGHFHAALVQKSMYDEVSPVVHVYAPPGPDVEDHQRRIEGFNARKESPTRWKQVVYTGRDFLERMLAERAGNVVVLSGNNGRKARYIEACVSAGFNVLADKPMCIDPEGFALLEQAFEEARERGVLLYDIMTERSEVTTRLQKALVHDADVFGRFDPGTADDPAVVMESVHHFFKYVAGRPNVRPPWFFDTDQQGEGIVDVTTHLVDLAFWACFPGEPLDYRRDIRLEAARRWPTVLTPAQFREVTRTDRFPPYLASRLDGRGNLPCFANGEITFRLRETHVRVKVEWRYRAPEGGGDTHFSRMRGTKAEVLIRQGKAQGFRPELYVEPRPGADRAALGAALERAVARLEENVPGIGLEETAAGWHVRVPDALREGHEAHFRRVMERYLGYLRAGRLPEWEEANMLAKYHLTTAALVLAR